MADIEGKFRGTNKLSVVKRVELIHYTEKKTRHLGLEHSIISISVTTQQSFLSDWQSLNAL